MNEELDRLTVGEYKESKKIPVMVVLDNIRSQNNIGSVFRTADAFRLEGIFLCGITAIPPHREIHKTALGATESVSWEYHKETTDAILELKNKGYHILVVEQVEGAESLDLLDIVFRLEKEFGIKIPRGGIQADALSDEGENLKEEDLVVDGILTPLGIEKIKASMPEVDPSRITEGFRADDIPTLFTVQTFVNISKNLLEEKEKTG